MFALCQFFVCQRESSKSINQSAIVVLEVVLFGLLIINDCTFIHFKYFLSIFWILPALAMWLSISVQRSSLSSSSHISYRKYLKSSSVFFVVPSLFFSQKPEPALHNQTDHQLSPFRFSYNLLVVQWGYLIVLIQNQLIYVQVSYFCYHFQGF